VRQAPRGDPESLQKRSEPTEVSDSRLPETRRKKCSDYLKGFSGVSWPV
jgi:hypothetical protein